MQLDTPSGMPPPITVSSRDFDRLETLLSSPPYAAEPAAQALMRELERADIVDPDAVPSDVVTMRSTVDCSDRDSGARHTLTLAYPHEADIERGRVSVLSAVGSALLGLSVGQDIAWPVAGGRTLHLCVDAIRYQPEAHGDLDR